MLTFHRFWYYFTYSLGGRARRTSCIIRLTAKKKRFLISDMQQGYGSKETDLYYSSIDTRNYIGN